MIRTAKAYAAALGAALAGLAPVIPAGPARWVYVVLAVLAALGVTWRVPNADPAHAGEPAGALAVVDAVPALVGGLLGGKGAAPVDDAE